MAKFLNTTAKDTLNSLISTREKQLKNPFYASTNMKKAMEVTFFNIDTENSTLDEDSKLYYSSHGNESPLLYVKIPNLLIYDASNIEAQLENGDFGLESSSTEGEAFLLPNTVVPVPGSFFYFNRYKSVGIFKITDTNVDTIENGANFWHINYKLDRDNIHMLDKQISREYVFMVDNTGTELNPMVLKDDYDLADVMDNVLDELCEYYKNLFYSSRVDTFIFEKDGRYFYDPMIIEFLKRNRLLIHLDKYLYLNQQVSLHDTFDIEYSMTIFRALEKNKLTKNILTTAVGRYVDEPLSVLSMRKEDYFQVTYLNYFNIASIHDYKLELISPMFLEYCRSNTKYKDNNKYMNIIIKYFNNEEITKSDLDLLEEINYVPEMSLYYILPILIFVINKAMKTLLT